MTNPLPFPPQTLTCVLGELFEQLVPVPVLWNVAHKEPVVIERYGNANFLSLPRFIVIQLKGWTEQMIEVW